VSTANRLYFIAPNGSNQVSRAEQKIDASRYAAEGLTRLPGMGLWRFPDCLQKACQLPEPH
jgi:hypothetical protein